MTDFDNNPGGSPPPYGAADPAPPAAVAASNTADERTWAMLGHLSAFSGVLIPFGSILGPLVIWLVKKDSLPFAAEHAKEALNFNITMANAGLIAGVLTLVLIGFLLLPVVLIAWVVLTVIAGIAANKGENYRYPFTLRLVN